MPDVAVAPLDRSLTETPAARAAHEQDLASDPAVSAFVSAHAGAGKTKLLVDRLLRLMLAGDKPADPARILCLTFTKAAAAEMAIRLHARLGDLATAPAAALDERLKALSIVPTAAARARARALFAEVLDLPGGMRINTIHAFCQSLLRRFPLEARLSPHFRLVEEADARAALDQAREAVLPTAPPDAIAALAGLISAEGFAALVRLLERHRDVLRPALALPAPALRAALRRVVGVTADSAEKLIADAVTWPAEAHLRHALKRVAAHGSPAVAERAARLLGWLNLPADLRAEHWDQWQGTLFLKDGKPSAVSQFCNLKLARDHADIQPTIAAEQARIASVMEQQRALAAADASAALLTLAAPVLAAYAGTKLRAGLLDYEDLINCTRALLADGGAAWVKYKLDGGIDHLLLDEVQDTAPPQWDVTDALTDDFFSGAGARDDAHRTVFAVGDEKQSIYGFQGAVPEEFSRHRRRYEAQVTAAGKRWHKDALLDVSFRSTAPVLEVVDAVFAQPEAAAGVRDAAPMRHVVRRAGQAGSVELWPLAPRPETTTPAPWAIPEHYSRAESAQKLLVEALADWIRDQTSGWRMLESENRPLSPGDVLILVRRRGDFDRALVGALKKRGVPVAGLDRMMLTEQPAVQDLMSLCAALLLPTDDLSLAEMLVSPLGGLSDDSLMDLAAGRGGTPLWDALRARRAERADWRAAHDFFATLLARADYGGPHALLCEALGPLGGRARLFARLGPEASEPIDELLAAALHYAALHPASLQGFLHWLRQSGAEVKREAEAAGGTVRIMTVHGAKGLEAPLVILPDTCALPPDEDRVHWTTDPLTGVPLFLWAPRAEMHCNATVALKDAAATRRAAEHNRLLYVALTRARDHLLICGWQPRGDVPPTSWYAMVEAGLRVADATAAPHVWGTSLHLAAPQTADAEIGKRSTETAAVTLPAWVGAAPLWQPSKPPPEPAVPRPLSPSRPDGALLGPVPPARSPLLRATGAVAERGTLIHALLQYLPDLPAADRPAAAHEFAARALPAEAADIAAGVLALLEHPDFAPLFGPGSRAEQALTGLVDGTIITGRVDRLVIGPDAVLVADYKTSRTPPASPERVPVLYLRQLAAYRAVLRKLYPGRQVRCALVWTEGPTFMAIPQAVLDSHAPAAPKEESK
jgi:ATP-dependent helicase/nuclease subunit A